MYYCFKGDLAAIHFEWGCYYFRRPFVAIKIFQGQCASSKRAPIIHFFKGIELTCDTGFSYRFVQEPSLYYNKTAVAMHSFKFAVFIQSSSYSDEISQLLTQLPTVIFPQVQACIRRKMLLGCIIYSHSFFQWYSLHFTGTLEHYFL